jgi:urease accessory protein
MSVAVGPDTRAAGPPGGAAEPAPPPAQSPPVRTGFGLAPLEPDDRYGGYRLAPAHYEPDRVPPEVARHSGVVDTLPTGSPGKIGLLELGFAVSPHGTELVHHYQKSPLQIMRPLYYDPLRPDMPFTYLMSTGGGVMQGDRLRTDLVFGPGTSGYVTTSAYTRVLRMEHDYAVAQTNIEAQDDSYVEYLPDPVIAFADARLYQRTQITVAESATVVAGETLISGRLARDERHRYTALAADLEVRRPGGSVVAVDRVRLVPSDGATGGLAVLGDRDVLSMLYVVTPLAPADELADLLHSELSRSDPGLAAGVSTLPGDVGVWLRIVGDDARSVMHAQATAWQAVRLRLTGRRAPVIRKS